MKIKIINTLPRLMTIEGLSKEDYRNLQHGGIVDVDPSVAGRLIKAGFAVESEPEKVEDANG